MSDYDKPIGARCCTPPTPGMRTLIFPDGTQSGVFGLDEVFAAVYSEGMPVSPDTAEEIVERLAAKNYIVPSARQQYCDLIIQQYEKYAESRVYNSQKQEPSSQYLRSTGRRAGLLSRLFRGKRSDRREGHP